MAERIEIVEVGPRDGLQNEPEMVPLEHKIALVNLLSKVGYTRIETGSFVSPKWVPQMAGSHELFLQINRAAGVSYTALTPNMRGYADAIESGADEVAVFAAASESFSKANINASIDQSFERFAPIVKQAAKEKIPVRGYVSCVTDCPYEGAIAPAKVAEVSARLIDAGCDEVSLGETLGRASSDAVDAMLTAVLSRTSPDHLAGHFHDTSGRALENVDVAIKFGLRVFDAAVGGLGGCPYAPGASGNVATGALARHLAENGFEAGLDQNRLKEAEDMVQAIKSGTKNAPN